MEEKTCTFVNNKLPGGSICGHDNTPKLNEVKDTKITRIYLDLDGVLANFDDQLQKIQ